MKRIKTIFLSSIIMLSGCAGLNPNPGERTTDIAWLSANNMKAFQTAKPHADAGEPWAQLRIAIFYYNGWGVESDKEKSAKWYSKVIENYGDDGWSKGRMIGSMGESGFFNQNSDALIARYNLADMYLKGEGVERNPKKALELVEYVIERSEGMPIFFCCEFATPRFFTQEQFKNLRCEILENI